MSTAKKKPTKGQKDYMTRLRDPRWQKKKNGILERDAYECTWCRAGVDDGRNLQVHHGYYSREFEGPWEYPDASLFTLCEKCHPQAEMTRKQVLEQLGHLPPQLHHHVYYGIQEMLESLAEGEVIDELEVPWSVKKGEAA